MGRTPPFVCSARSRHRFPWAWESGLQTRGVRRATYDRGRGPGRACVPDRRCRSTRYRQMEAALLPAVVRPATPRAVLRRSGPADLPPLRAVGLLDRWRTRVRMLHDSRRTEQAYLYRSRAFIRLHGLRHPAEMGGLEVEGFLTTSPPTASHCARLAGVASPHALARKQPRAGARGRWHGYRHLGSANLSQNVGQVPSVFQRAPWM